MPEERRNLYRILHVQPEAPLEVIRASYRTLMSTLRSHPDLGGDPEAAARINAAYAVLADPERRRAYDRALEAGQAGRTRPAAQAAAGASAEEALAAHDPATWLADRCCPYCRRSLPSAVHADTRCSNCGSPLFRRPAADRGELFGRRRSPRNARPIGATLRLPGVAGDHAVRLRDLSLGGLSLLSPLPAAPRSAMRVMTAGFDGVAVVVGCQRQAEGWLLHGELLTLQLLRQQGVYVSTKV
ncbi:MAG: DnaJ domain-containing protein [Burkholderiales bacterium]|nr:DnaJ domain-containing protein [Burkholderiales bacterium]